MSTTAQGTSIRCDNPTCSLPATVEQGVYGYCATHADRAQGVPHTPPAAGPSAPLVQVMGGGTIGLLLEQASGHSNRRVTALAEKIEAQIEQLRELIASLDQHLPCRKGCGRVSPNPQGRGAHERHCTHASSDT